MTKKEEKITMTQKELSRYDVIKNLINKEINGSEASKQLDLSVRQVKRLKAKVINFGIKGLIHGNRNKESNSRINPEIIEKAENYLKEKYFDFKPAFAAEKLEENHNIKLSNEKVRQIMIENGLWKPRLRKKVKKIHTWRARKEYFGEMEQFDGSYHHWFEDRGEECCLLLSIDDAKGEITHAKFDLNESTKATFMFWNEYVDKNGLPLSIYLDKFSTYKINHKNAVDNKDLITQFQRAMNQLGVKLITAHSPEAKGRVERVFQTLQDRLVKELRLANISTPSEGNEFLKTYIPKFKAKFAVVPQKNKNLHRKVNKELKDRLPQIFSIQSERKVNNDYTVMFKGQYFQLSEKQPTTVYKRDTVVMEEHLNGTIKINLKGHYLNYIILPKRPKKIIDIKLPALTIKKQPNWKPPISHPWRRQLLFSKNCH